MTKVSELGQKILKEKYFAEGETTPEHLFRRVAKVCSIPDAVDALLASFKEDIDVEGRDLWDDKVLSSLFGKYADLAERVILRRARKRSDFRRVPTSSINRAALAWKEYEDKYFEAMENLDFMPATPILISAGRGGMLSSCFFLRVEDSMESIFETVKKVAIISQKGGGCGIDFSLLRPEGAVVKGTNGKSSGPLSFMRVFNETGNQVKGGGIRRAAMLAGLSVTHPDIMKFIHCKDKEGDFSNFNLSVFVTDTFMKAVAADDNIELVHPTVQPVRIRAKAVWDELTKASWKSGEPGIIFEDAVNRGDVFAGRYGRLGVNPCLAASTLLIDGDRLQRISSGGESWTSCKTGEKEGIRLICNNGMELVCTKDHEIKLEDGSLLAAEKTLNRAIKWGLGNRKADKIDEKDVLRGFLFGDGFLCGRKQGVSVRFNDEKESEVADMLKRYGFYKQSDPVYYTNYKALSLLIGDISFLFKRVWERVIPDEFLLGDSNKSAGFLLGLFSANGSCNKNGQISLKATCLASVKLVQIMLSSFGIPSWQCMNDPQKITWKNGEYTSKRSYNLQIAGSNAEKFLNKIGFLHEYKRANVRHTDHIYDVSLEVKEIVPVGIIEVWDYTMKNPPHYNMCNGLVAANCGELPLIHAESCNLAAINLNNMVYFSAGKLGINTGKLADLTKLVTRFLDNVVDLNNYPLPEIEEASLRSRKLGIGVMGLHDALLGCHIAYGSKEGMELIDEIFQTINVNAHEESINFGKVRGVPAVLTELGLNRRNANLLTCQPTGTISAIAGVSSGIEPVFQWEYTRKDSYGEHKIQHDILRVYGNALPPYAKTALEISPETHVQVQAEIQKRVDQSISKTCNCPYSTTVEDVSNIYKLAYELGCKSITVYRSGSRKEEVLNVEREKEEVKEIVKEKEECEPGIRNRPRILFGATIRVSYGTPMYITINEDPKGVREVFVNAGRCGTEVAAHLEAIGRLLSNSLKYGVPCSVIARQLRGIRSNPIFSSGKIIKSIPDGIAQALEEYAEIYEGFSQYIEDPVIAKSMEENREQLVEQTGDLCQECGEPLYHEGACETCKSCGWSKCS